MDFTWRYGNLLLALAACAACLGVGVALLIAGRGRLAHGEPLTMGRQLPAAALSAAGLLSTIAGVVLVVYVALDLVCGATFEPCTTLVPRENAYTRIGFERLGDHLGRRYPKSKAVLVTNIMYPSADPEARDNLFIAALKKGMAGRVDLVATKNFGLPPVTINQPSAPQAVMMMPEMLITAKDWDTLLIEHPDADLFISLAGLPMDVEKMHLWQMKDGARPKLALVNAQQLSMLYTPIAKGLITVVLHPNPSVPFDPNRPVPDDPKVAFNDRWLLITPSNVTTIAKANKGLFLVDFAATYSFPPARAPTTAK